MNPRLTTIISDSEKLGQWHPDSRTFTNSKGESLYLAAAFQQLFWQPKLVVCWREMSKYTSEVEVEVGPPEAMSRDHNTRIATGELNF